MNRTYIHFSALFIVCVLQVFSPVLFVPGGEDVGASFFRVFLLSAATVIFFRNGAASLSAGSRFFLLCNAGLVIVLFISTLWTNNLGYGLKHVAYFTTILCTSYVFMMLIRDINRFRIISATVAITGLFIVGIAIFEIDTGIHFFRSSLQDASELDRSLSYISENQAWFTFGNPNDLAVHLAICCFCAAFAWQRSFLVVLYCIPALYVSDLLDSRIVVATIVIFLVLVLSFRFIQSVKLIVSASVVMLAAGGISLLVLLANVNRVEFLDVSSFVRLQLLRSAIDMAQTTMFIGIGAGGYEGEMWSGGFVGGTFGITNPHNAFGRMFAEVGVIGLLLLSIMLFGPLFSLRRMPLHHPLVGRFSAATVSLPLLLSVGSDPASSSSLQLFIALLISGSQVLLQQDGRTEFAGNAPTGRSRVYL